MESSICSGVKGVGGWYRKALNVSIRNCAKCHFLWSPDTIKHNPFMRQKALFCSRSPCLAKFNCLSESFLFMIFLSPTPLRQPSTNGSGRAYVKSGIYHPEMKFKKFFSSSTKRTITCFMTTAQQKTTQNEKKINENFRLESLYESYTHQKRNLLSIVINTARL